MAKKYRAEHIRIFAVYKKFMILGKIGRFLKVAFPDRADAEKWVEDHCRESSFYKPEDFIVEEMPAVMRAWDGK